MVVAAVVLAVVSVVLAVALWRARAAGESLAGRLSATEQRAAALDVTVVEVRAELDDARRERDEALERLRRARRDAADVARRVRAESEAREALEAEVEAGRLREEESRSELESVRATARELQSRVEGLDAALAGAVAGSVRTDAVPAPAAEELWVLALAAVERTWEVSVAPSPGMASPLAESEDRFRTAVEIELAAAREDAGALIGLQWEGDAVLSPEVAVPALALVQDLIRRLAKTADDASMLITCRPEGCSLSVHALDDTGEPVPLDGVAPRFVAGASTYWIPAPADDLLAG